MDKKLKSTIMGKVDVMIGDTVGLWYEAQLAASNAYREAYGDLITRKALGTSTGALPGSRDVAPNGFIKRWAIAEVSNTPMPAEPRMMERPVAEIKAAFKAIGLELPDERSADKGAEEARQKAIELERERLALLEIELVNV